MLQPPSLHEIYSLIAMAVMMKMIMIVKAVLFLQILFALLLFGSYSNRIESQSKSSHIVPFECHVKSRVCYLALL